MPNSKDQPELNRVNHSKTPRASAPDHADIDRRDILRWLSSIAACGVITPIAAALEGCGGGGGGGGSAAGGSTARKISGTVNVGVPISRVVTPYGGSAVSSNGSFNATASGTVPHMMIALDATGHSAGFAFHLPGNAIIDITPASTALTFAVILARRSVADRTDFDAFASTVTGLSTFSTLVQLLTDGMKSTSIISLVGQQNVITALTNLYTEMSTTRSVRRGSVGSQNKSRGQSPTRLPMPAQHRDAGLYDDQFTCDALDSKDKSAVTVEMANAAGRLLRVYRRKMVGTADSGVAQPTFKSIRLPDNMMMGRPIAGLENVFSPTLEPNIDQDTVSFVTTSSDRVIYEYWTAGIGTQSSGNTPPSNIPLADSMNELFLGTICVYLVVPFLSTIIEIKDEVLNVVVKAFIDRFAPIAGSFSSSVTLDAFVQQLRGIVQAVFKSTDFWQEIALFVDQYLSVTELAAVVAYDMLFWLNLGLMGLNISFFAGEIFTLPNYDKNVLDLGAVGGFQYFIRKDGTLQTLFDTVFTPNSKVWVNNQQVPTVYTVAGLGLAYLTATLPELKGGTTVLIEIYDSGTRIAVSSLVMLQPISVTVQITKTPPSGSNASGQLSITGVYVVQPIPSVVDTGNSVNNYFGKVLSGTATASGSIKNPTWTDSVSSVSDTPTLDISWGAPLIEVAAVIHYQSTTKYQSLPNPVVSGATEGIQIDEPTSDLFNKGIPSAHYTQTGTDGIYDVKREIFW